MNLSRYKLNKDEESILQKGLNFIPTPNREHEAKLFKTLQKTNQMKKNNLHINFQDQVKDANQKIMKYI